MKPEKHSCPALGFDLDGCIDEAPQFFRPLSEIWPAPVYVITYRRDYDKAKEYVDSFGLNYAEIILVERFEDKATVIAEKDIGVYFDDQDEMLMYVPENVIVMKIRNGGNFDFDTQQWLYSAATSQQI